MAKIKELKVPVDRHLHDDIYDASKIEHFLYLPKTYNGGSELSEEGEFYICRGPNDEITMAENFIKENPDYIIACAYETNTVIFLGNRPTKFLGNHIGSGFNYGSTNLLSECPEKILILAEND